jgi:hypothetical protein
LSPTIPKDGNVLEGRENREAASGFVVRLAKRAEALIVPGCLGQLGKVAKDRTGVGRCRRYERSSRPGTLTLPRRPLRRGSRCKRVKGRCELMTPARETRGSSLSIDLPSGRKPAAGSKRAKVRKSTGGHVQAVHAGGKTEPEDMAAMPAALSENTPRGVFGRTKANRRCSERRAAERSETGQSGRQVDASDFGSTGKQAGAAG